MSKKFVRRLDPAFPGQLRKNSRTVIEIVEEEKIKERERMIREGYFDEEEAAEFESRIVDNLRVSQKFTTNEAFSKIFYDSIAGTFTMHLKSTTFSGRYWIPFGSTITVGVDKDDNLIVRNDEGLVRVINYEVGIVLDKFSGEMPECVCGDPKTTALRSP